MTILTPVGGRRLRGALLRPSIMILLLLPLLPLAGCGAADEVVELLSQGGETLLRDPMRPLQAGPRVLLIALDGVGEDELLDALTAGALPVMGGLLGAPSGDGELFGHGFAVPGVLSILPSTTLAAWTSVFTGEPPARSGVPGNEWFVREEAAFYAPAPVTVTEHEQALQVYTDDLLGRAIRVPTLYERADIRAYVSLSQVHRGADLLTTPSPGAFGDLVTAVAEGTVGDDPVSQRAYEELDLTSVESVVESLREHGVPRLQVVYFPGIDLYTHVAHEPLAEQRAYLREALDGALAEIVAVYREQGALEETYVVIVSDHGHTPVLNDDRHALEAEGEDEPPAVLARSGFRVRPPVLQTDEDEEDFQAVLAYQGAFAYVYLADRSTCPAPGDRCAWSRPPRLEEDVLPVGRAFDAANRTGDGVPELQGTLDLIFAREPRPAGQDAAPFQVWDGERLVPIGEYLASTPRPELLALESRIEGLGVGPYGNRAGDVLLLARSGGHLDIADRYYFSGRYRSWHGSPAAQDSRIPLLVGRVGGSGAEIRDQVRELIGDDPTQLSVTALVLGLLGRE